jgi:hypothetical protein
MSVYMASSAGKNGEGSFYVVINPLAFEGIYRPMLPMRSKRIHQRSHLLSEPSFTNALGASAS